MIKADLINKISRDLNIPKQEAEEGVNLFFNTIKDAILRGEEIEIRGFGSFKVVSKKTGFGRDIRRKKQIRITKGKRIKFRSGQELKSLT